MDKLVKLKKNNIFSSYLCINFPLQIWTFTNSNQAIMKVIIARSFKFGQLIQELKAQSNLPSANLAMDTCNKDILKKITASILKLGQLIKDDEKITW